MRLIKQYLGIPLPRPININLNIQVHHIDICDCIGIGYREITLWLRRLQLLDLVYRHNIKM